MWLVIIIVVIIGGGKWEVFNFPLTFEALTCLLLPLVRSGGGQRGLWQSLRGLLAVQRCGHGDPGPRRWPPHWCSPGATHSGRLYTGHLTGYGRYLIQIHNNSNKYKNSILFIIYGNGDVYIRDVRLGSSGEWFHWLLYLIIYTYQPQWLWDRFSILIIRGKVINILFIYEFKAKHTFYLSRKQWTTIQVFWALFVRVMREPLTSQTTTTNHKYHVFTSYLWI